MSISSHSGIFILVVVGLVTVLGVIIAAIIETRHVGTDEPLTPQPSEKPANKKRP